MKRPLTPKQQMFVKEYLVDLNATQAAIRSGYSAKRASEIGSELLRKTTVSAVLQAEMNKRAAKVEITAEDVLQSIITIRDMAVQSKKLNEALKANELLGKHLKLFTDKVESSVNVTHSGVLRVPGIFSVETWGKKE